MTSTTVRQHVANLSSNFSRRLLAHPRLGKAIHRALDATGRWHQRSCPLTAPVVVVLVLLLGLERSLSAANVLSVGLSFLREKMPDLSLKAITPEAFCHARRRLGFATLKVLFEHTAAAIRPRRSFHGLRVYALDTMDLRLPDTPANLAAFGTPGVASGRAGFPQIGASVLLDVSGRRVRDVVFAPVTECERRLAVPLIKNLKRGDLVLQDRGLAGVWVLDAIRDQDADYVTRIPRGWKPSIIKKLGPGDYLVELIGVRPVWRRSEGTSKAKPRKIRLMARLIVYRLPGSGQGVIRLLTSLLDHKAIPAQEIAEYYHRRWDIEMAFDEIKTHLATVAHGTTRTIFRSKTPDGVLQEAYGLFAVYNMIRQLIHRAADNAGVSPLSISFVETLERLRRSIPALIGPRRLSSLTLAQLLRDIADCTIHRPRRPRACARAVKVRTSRYDAKRPRHRSYALAEPIRPEMADNFSMKRKAA